MPIDFKIHTNSGDELVVGWNDQLSQDFFFQVDSPVTDVSFDPGDWILKDVTETTTGVEGEASLSLSVPSQSVGGSARLMFSVPTDGRVTLTVYDASGRLVATLEDGEMSAGVHEVVWDGAARGGTAASGVYFAKLTHGTGTATGKLLLLR
jgi:hypothetical protein